MPAFVVKVTLQGSGDLLPPITAMAADEQAAIALVRSCRVDPEDKVEAKGIRDDIMNAAFGEQTDGTIAIRGDWIWSGDKPKSK